MLFGILFLSFVAGFWFVLGLFPMKWEVRPTLRAFQEESLAMKRSGNIFKGLRSVAMINKPLCAGTIRQRIARDLAKAHSMMTPEEFFLMKEVIMALLLVLTYPMISQDVITAWFLMCFGIGYMAPEYYLKSRINKVKATIVKELPDAIDLLSLCVNAGLDFMLALKWVVEKSPPSVTINELNILLQDINVGKTRRNALKDLAARYDLPDVSTFTRTLIQADKMGTSVADSLNILSEDMRLARFRRGEQMAMKAPLKLLVPLLFCIFPVVGIFVALPVLIQFLSNNPLQSLTATAVGG